MNRENAAKWVAALRSGEFEQGTGCFRPSANTYCCLGVLYVQHGGTWEQSEPWNSAFSPEDAVGVIAGAGLTTSDAYRYAEMNDRGASFAEIAAQIEKDAGLLNYSATPVPHSTGGIL